MISFNSTCIIYNKKTIKLSPNLKITRRSTINWVSDSNMKLLGFKDINSYLGFCYKCFHSTLFPRFDTKILYGQKGYKIRKEFYEKYFPQEPYDKNTIDFNTSLIFQSLNNEFSRFYQTTKFINKNIKSTFKDIKKIKILDWGGGDGYISSLYASMLKAMTGLDVYINNYDLTDWDTKKSIESESIKLQNQDSFHLIFVSHVLEHTHEPKQMIESCKKFLIQGGMIICEVPDERLHILKALFRKKFGLDFHVSHFSKKSLYRLLQFSGFKNIHTTYHFNSSYRGTKLPCILGIAQKNATEKKDTYLSSSLIELLSLFIFAIKRAYTKIL